uniref:Uncharacterized protein n=1 Tax=Echinococcus canadensis TaxID=519352 RepID=A0A915EY47_9CEST
IKQVCFVFAAALVFYSHVSSAASPAGEELVSLLVCRTCDGIFPRSACLESQEIQSTCLQKILEEEELFSRSVTTIPIKYHQDLASKFIFLIFLVILYIPKSFKNTYSNIIFGIKVAKSLLHFDFVWFLRVKHNISVIKQEAVIPEALSPFFKLSHGTEPLNNYNSILKYSILSFLCLFR